MIGFGGGVEAETVRKYRPCYHNPWGMDGKGPTMLVSVDVKTGQRHVWVDDTMIGKTLIMAHWEPEENVDVNA